MLLIDGVRYKEWTPTSEDEFEQVVREHAQDIFSENAIYFDKKQKLKSLAGVGSIPDGLAIVFGNSPEWHIVEVELSSHDLYQHVVPQVDKFIYAVDNPNSRNKIVEALYEAIDNDEFTKLKIRQRIGQNKEIHKYLSDLITRPPVITIVIEKATSQLSEALRKYIQNKVVEFRTFTRERTGLVVHAHLFKPLYEPVSEPPSVQPPQPPHIEMPVRTLSNIKWHYFEFPKESRSFFPGFRISFKLEVDGHEIQTAVVGAAKGTRDGDPNAGYYIQRNLGEWVERHPEMKVGDKLRITVIEPMKKYRLEIVKQ